MACNARNAFRTQRPVDAQLPLALIKLCSGQQAAIEPVRGEGVLLEQQVHKHPPSAPDVCAVIVLLVTIPDLRGRVHSRAH